MQDRVRQVGVVVAILVLELADVVGEGDLEIADVRETFVEVLAMSLDGRGERPRIHSIGSDADRTAPPAGAEGENLVEAIEQAGPFLLADQQLDLRPIRGELRALEPAAQVLDGRVAVNGIDMDRLDAGGGGGEQVHGQHSRFDARCHAHGFAWACVESSRSTTIVGWTE